MVSAMSLAVMICFIMLPVISISDDLLAGRQSALPYSAQTWKMASEGASAGMGYILLAGLYLLLLTGLLMEDRTILTTQWVMRPLAAQLVRAQRLRPPEFHLSLPFVAVLTPMRCAYRAQNFFCIAAGFVPGCPAVAVNSVCAGNGRSCFHSNHCATYHGTGS
jgi:hypothetical protein